MKIKKVFPLFCLFLGVFSGLLFCGVVGINISSQSQDQAINMSGGPKAPAFDEMMVRHAKRLCNGGLHKIFSQDGRDFVDFWSTANEVKLDLERVYTCFRLFYNNIKFCEMVDYSVVEQVLKSTPKLFDSYFEEKVKFGEGFNFIKEHVEDLMLSKFTDNLSLFKLEPGQFIASLSHDITDLVRSRLSVIQRDEEQYLYREKLRQLIIRFSDMMISKLIWYDQTYESIWPSFLSIADSLHTIGMRGIINDQDNLDELWDSLTKRFIWYLEVKGSSLPVGFYEQIEEDLNNNVVFFLEVDEQDDGIKSKKELIAEAVVGAKAKAIAAEKGLVMESYNFVS